jgi:cell division transport system permease protein
VLALALAIPISLAGATVTLRGWLEPVIVLGEQEGVVLVLLHPSLELEARRAWIDGQAARRPEWRLAVVESEELSARLSTWFPYLEDLLAREGPEMLPPMVEITTREPQQVAALSDDAAVLAVGPTSSVNQVVGRVARRFSTVLLVIAAALVASAILLTAVWVHLEVHRNAEEIAIMRLMGATESTVKGPFLVAVAIPAVIAALASVVFSVISVGWIARLAEPMGFQVSGVTVVTLAVQVVGAVVLPLVSALATLERYAQAEE